MKSYTTLLLLLSFTSLYAYDDYGEFTVAEHVDLNPANTPSLEQMDLLKIGVDFQVFSQLHYDFAPASIWPDAVQDYVRDARRKYGDAADEFSQLPDDFSLGLPDSCLMIERIDRDRWPKGRSQYEHLSLDNREVTLLSYPTPADKVNGSSRIGPPHLAIFEPGTTEPAILELDSYDFDAFAHGDEILLIFNTDYELRYRIVRWLNGAPELSDPILLFEADKNPDSFRGPIEDMASTAIDGVIHLAWQLNYPGRAIHHMAVDPEWPNFSAPTAVTAANSSLVSINTNGDSVWLHWIDSRFGREGFSPKNMRKWFSAQFSRSGTLMETLVINTPFDDADQARLPVFMWSYDHFEVIAWGVASPEISRISERPLKLNLLNTRTREVSREQTLLSSQEILQEAERQYARYLNNHPVHGTTADQSKQCHQWSEWIDKRRDVIPEGTLMTPDGLIHAPTIEMITIKIPQGQTAEPGNIVRVRAEPTSEYTVESVMLLYKYGVLIDRQPPFEFDVNIPEDQAGFFELSATAQYKGRNTATSYLTIPVE